MRRRAFLKSTTHSFIPITNAVVTCSNATYNGNSQVAQNISVVLNGLTLVESTDYVVSVNSGGVNAGSYPVVVSGIGNYEGTASGTFVIDSKYVYNPTITISPTSYTYDGSQKKPSVISVKDGSVEIPSSEYTVSYGSNVNTGTGVVYISDVSGGNYDVNGSVNFTITKANPTYTAPTANNRTYDTTSKALLNAGYCTGGTIQYSSDNSTWSTVIPSGTDANTYTSYWRIVGDSNHNDKASETIVTTISPKTVSSPTVILNPSAFTYNGYEQYPTEVTVKDGNTVIPSVEYIYTITPTINAGTYATHIMDEVGGNYNIAQTDASYVIKKANPVQTEPQAIPNLKYNEEEQTLVSGGVASVSGNFTYENNTAINVGNYTVTWQFTPIYTSNYNTVSGTVTTRIEKGDCPITVYPSNATYNGQNQDLLIVNKPSTSGTMHYKLGDSGTWSLSIPQKKNAGGPWTVYCYMDATSNWNAWYSRTEPAVYETRINKAQGQILEIAYSILNLHYNGEYQDLCTPASGTSVIMYNVNGGPFSTEIPQGKDANVSNLITYYSAENANYTSSVTDSFYAASIKKAVLTLEYANEPITTVNECETVNNPCIIVDSGGTIVNYYDGELIYSSSNENVAIVDSGGTVTGINQGNASITCSAASTNNCWITVPEDQKLTYSVNVINAPTHLDGAYIENTNGDLFSASCWPTKGTGQVNSIIVVDGNWKRRVYVDETYNMARLSYQSGYQVPGVSAATSMDDGEYNTNIIEPLLDGDGMIMRDFTVGGHTYLPSYEEMLTLLNYKDQIDECRVAIGKQATPDDVLRWWTSTYWGESYYAEAGDWNTCVYGVNGKGAMIRRNMGYTLRIGKYN